MSRLLWLLMLGSLLACGCERRPIEPTPGKVTSEDVLRDAGQAVNTAAEYSQQTKEETRKTLKTRLQELDAEIAKLREKGGELKDEAKANWDQRMIELETKQEAARVKLAEVGNSSVEAWKDVQKGAPSAWDELEKAFHDAAREF